MKYKENNISEDIDETAAVEIILDSSKEESETEKWEADINEITKTLSELIISASELITKLNKSRGK